MKTSQILLTAANGFFLRSSLASGSSKRKQRETKQNLSLSAVLYAGIPSEGLNIFSVTTWLSLLTPDNSKTPIRAKISSSHVSLKVAMACCFTRSRRILIQAFVFQQFPLSCCGQAKAWSNPHEYLQKKNWGKLAGAYTMPWCCGSSNNGASRLGRPPITISASETFSTETQHRRQIPLSGRISWCILGCTT